MTLDDLRKLVTSPALFGFDRIIGAPLVTLVYGLGIAALGLWGIAHFVGGFATGFASGLWSILEIAVFGALMLAALRVACELVLVFLAAHEDAVGKADVARPTGSLLNELRDAIDELSDGDDYDIAPATEPLPPEAVRNGKR